MWETFRTKELSLFQFRSVHLIGQNMQEAELEWQEK